MKIKIMQEVPVNLRLRPRVGDIYDVVRIEERGRIYVYFIMVNGFEVGILSRESKIIAE